MLANAEQMQFLPLDQHEKQHSQWHFKVGNWTVPNTTTLFMSKIMLIIIQALKKWHVDLLEMHIHICTDHRTLQNFNYQRDLSQQQARWMKYMFQYEYSITYINKKWNTVADALFWLPDSVNNKSPIVITAFIFIVESNPKLIIWIKNSYKKDPGCLRILKNLKWVS